MGESNDGLSNWQQAVIISNNNTIFHLANALIMNWNPFLS